MSIWEWLLNPAGLTAHGFCLSWAPGLVALHAGSDAVIGLAYFSIPVAMAWFIQKRRDSQHRPVAYLFAAFILACGATHLFSILTLWVPAYGVEGLVKAVTAALSIGTAIVLWPLVPRLLALPTPELLVALNAELSRRVAAQEEATAKLRKSEAGMRALNADLERRVAERTSALEAEIVARRDAEEKFRLVTESAPTAIIMIDGEGTIELVNMQTDRTFGYSRDELLGRSVDMLLPDRLRANHGHHRATFFASPTPRAMGIGQELFGRRKDGSEFPVEIGLNPLTTPEGPKVISSITDITKRKEIEKALGDSEQQIRLMIDSIRGHAIFLLDPEGRVITWNIGAERLKGFTKEEIIGRHFSLFYPPEDVANGKPERELIVAAREGRVEDEGWRILKDGSRFMASVIINAVRDSRGELRGFVKVTRDVTDRRQIENKLIEANERFTLVIESAPSATIMIDDTGNIELVNARAEAIFGYSREELLGRSVDILLPDRLRANHGHHRATFFAAPTPRAMGIGHDLFGRRKDGSEFPVEIGLNPLMTPAGPRVVSSISDITKRKEMEKALWDSERQMTLIFDSIQGHAIIMLDVEGRVISWNTGAERLKGYGKEEIVGRHFSLFYSPEDAENGKPERELIVASREGRAEDEGWRVRKDGSRFMASVTINAIKDSHGDLRGFVKVTRDITDRKRIEDQLIETHQRFAVAADAAGLAFWDFDIETRSVHWDDQMFKLYGVDRSEGNDHPLRYKYVHADDIARVEAEIRLAVAGTRRFDSEYRIVRPDGSVRHTKAVASLRRDPDGRGGRLMGVSFDITDRKEAENKLIEANQRFALAADAAGLGFWDYDIDTQSVQWDDRMYRIYGLARGDAMDAASRRSRLHPDDRARAEGELLEAIAGGRPFDTEFRIVQPGGEVRHLRAAAAVKRDTKTVGARVFGVNFDITERKEIENKLIEANERFALAAEAAALGFWEYEIDTRAVRWDAQLFKLHGLAPEEAAQPAAIRASQVHPDDRAKLDAAFVDVAAGFELEYRIVLPDGGVRHLRGAASLKRDPTGRGSRLLGVSFDITELKEAQLGLEQARDEAQAADRAKSGFLASMSHEIRTPMNGVIGFADLLLDSGLTEQQRNHATRLQDAAKSLLSLMNDILDLSKIEAGKLEVETIPVNLEAVVHGAASVVRTQMAAKGLDLRIERSRDLPDWIESDPTRVRQILLNLLSNALKFTDHGRITVRCSRETVEDEDLLRFEVEDTGIGIPADRQHLLFRDFSQVDSSTTRRYGGTGLGLSICKRLVRAMGGEIGVRSVAGAGSTIWFTIRLRTCPAPDLSVARDPTTVAANPARVLVADDLEMNRDIVEAMLRRAGHSVTAVENGRQAVVAVQESDFDVVLMDMEMPEMDGLEATRAIRRLDERIRHIPIVALTANAFSEDQQRCHAAGMNDFLPKPISRDGLLAMVAKWSGGIPPEMGETTPATPLVLDLAVLDAFDTALGVEGAARFSGKFRKQVRDAVVVLTSAEEPALIAREAHKLVNLAGNLGCVELVGFARNLCSEAKRVNGDVDHVLIDLPATVDRAIAALAARYPLIDLAPMT